MKDYKIKVNLGGSIVQMFCTAKSVAEVYKELHKYGIKNEEIVELLVDSPIYTKENLK
jgi:hypothetical protein